ncbi:hypothetical protein [Psychroflexus aestuariivivens]|uniref:hypothetical protein n=1 Tax=Psychroflexus aestuariivivens TaxID=1795040 RepID=UPI000FDBE10A|nr:hypothetical protein [Psychroflexus aestuariivivens]
MSRFKHYIKAHALLSFFSPALGLYYAIRLGDKKYLRVFLLIFVTIYGSLFHTSFLGDGSRHWARVYDHYQYLEFQVFWEELIAIVSFKPLPSTNADVYIHLLSYFIGGVLNVPDLFFVCVAFVFAYFYSGTMVKLLSYVDWKSQYNKFYLLFFLMLFILWKAPGSMQTVRTWTGMYVLLYAVISYYETKRRKYLLLALTPPLIHVGFFALAIPIWLVLFTGFRNPKVYFIIFLVSTLASNIVNQESLKQNLSQTELGASKVNAYHVDDERADIRQEQVENIAKKERFYKDFERNKIHHHVLTFIIIFIFLILSNRHFGDIEKTLFSYGLAMASFSNFLTSIYAVHNRGWQIAGFLILALMVIFLSKNNLKSFKFSTLKIKLPLSLAVILMTPYLLFLLSDFIYKTSVYVAFMPIFSWINPDMAINIRGFIDLFI